VLAIWGQGVAGGEVTVDHREGLAVMAPDADLQRRGSVLGHDHPGDLQAEDLSGDDAVLDDDIRAGLREQQGELLGQGGWSVRRIHGRHGRDRVQRVTVDQPDRRGRFEQRGPAGQDVGAVLREDAQVFHVVAHRPGQGRAQRPDSLVAGQEPAPGAGTRGGATGERAGLQIGLADVLGEQRPQLGGVERRPLLRREGRAGAQDSEGPVGAFLRRP
jgi:hypothetical protein